MLEAAHGDKRRKKKGATYGKAIRRQGPAHLIPGHDLSEKFQKVKIELPARAVASKEPEVRSSASKKRQPPMAQADVFDFPSDSDNEALSPGRTKKRKLSPKALESTSKPDQGPQPQTITMAKQADKAQLADKKSETCSLAKEAVVPSTGKPNNRTMTNDMQRAPSSTARQYQSQPSLQTPPSCEPAKGTLSPSAGLQEKIQLAQATERKPVKTVKQNSSATKKSRGVDKTLRQSSMTSLERHIGESAERSPLQLSTLNEDSKRTLDETPQRTTSATSSATISRPRHSSPPVLTPKSAKTWKVLLGNDEDTDKQTITGGNEAVRTTERPARVRLIDTLSQQKGMAKFESSRSQSFDGCETELHFSDRSDEEVDAANSSTGFSQVLQTSGVIAALSVSTASGPRITYNRQRSMLAEQDDIQNNVHMDSQSSNGDSHRRRGFAPTLFSSFDTKADENMEDMQTTPAIRSVHELRQAGASKRFMDEVDDLCDRITTHSTKPSIRRSALLELLDKVQDKTFLRNLITSGAEQKILMTMGDESDDIAAFLLASVLLLLLDPTSTKLSPTQLASFGFVSFCRRYLKTSDGIVLIAKQRKTNMSKIAVAAMGECQRKLLNLPLWGDVRPETLSPRTVVLACLALALPQASGRLSAHVIVPTKMVEELFLILQTCAARPLEMNDGTLQCNLLLLMSILGHIYLPHGGDSGQPQWGPEYLRSICCVATKLLVFEGTEMATLRKVVLSLTLNITNINDHAATIFATPSFMHTILRSISVEFERLMDAASDDDRMYSLDALVLMLGIMINVVDELDGAPEHILEGSSLSDALRIFSAHAEKSFEADSVEDSHFNVVFGYLAVLLGYLALMEHLTGPIRRGLPGGNLRSLTIAIKEFIYHHQQVDALSQGDIHNHSAHTALTERLSRMLKKICKVEAGSV